ncbi:MAG: nucleotidyltransferase family protein, partial [Burkholderiaceae bacterium]
MGRKLAISQSDLEALCRRNRISRLSLFGSEARGTARPDSDVDLPSLISLSRQHRCARDRPE